MTEAPSDSAKRSSKSAWCAVANMGLVNSFGPGGALIREGSKHFLPGTKLYVLCFYWGMGGDSATVVGRHRSSRRFVKMVISSKWMANWRVALVYEPWVVRQLEEEGEYDRADPGSAAAKLRAQAIVESWKGRTQECHSTR